MMLRIVSSLLVTGLLVACAAPTVDDESTEATQDELRGKNNPCATVRCAAGFKCVRHGNRASCVVDPDQPPPPPPPPPDCTSVTQCYEYDDYCGGCSCRAMSVNQSIPACTTTIVNCFAQPCAVNSGTLACVNGKCTFL